MIKEKENSWGRWFRFPERGTKKTEKWFTQKREKQENKEGTSTREESRGRDVSLGSHRGIVNRHQSLN
jgi:hypothetical protein